VTEREREFFLSLSFPFPSDIKAALHGGKKVFMLAQESAKKTKQWYESTDRLRK
jgi:hypothetical protein